MGFFSGKDGQQIRLGIASAERRKPNEPGLVFSIERDAFSALDFVSDVGQQLLEHVQIGGLMPQSGIHGGAQHIAAAYLRLIAQPLVVGLV